MRIDTITITNCKSYRDRTTIDLDPNFNVLVGPNAGGKSNTLDIINIVLRKCFLHNYHINRGGSGPDRFRDLNRNIAFNNTDAHLDKHFGFEDDQSEIVVRLIVGESDIDNLETIRDNEALLAEEVSRFRNVQGASRPENLGSLREEDFDRIEEGQVHEYRVLNGDLQLNAATEEAQAYARYLRSLNFHIVLSRNIEALTLDPVLVQFPPYRAVSASDLEAQLASQNLNQLLQRYFATTSRQGPQSLLQIASVFFAEKRRQYELDEKAPWPSQWDDDPHVQRVSYYLERLGYDWTLEIQNSRKNVYRVTLKGENRTLRVDQASSGEKEILNFILGIFALGTRGGLVVVDEPELHLHPRWQDLLREIYVDISEETSNQIIITTHSPTFIRPSTVRSLRRVYKAGGEATNVATVERTQVDDTEDLLHIVNAQNNERMFFADRVLLVEGITDRLVFEALVELYRDRCNVTEIVEVLEVGGKGNFDKYGRFLDALDVPYAEIGDLDYITSVAEGMGYIFETDYDGIDERVLKDKNSRDRRSIARALEVAIDENDTDDLEEILGYVRGRFQRLRPDLSAEEEKELHQTLADLRDEDIYILSSGEIEHYLPDGVSDTNDVIELTQENRFREWLRGVREDGEVLEIEGIVLDVLPVTEETAEEALGEPFQ